MLVIKSFWPVMDLDMRTTLCNTGSNPFSLFCQTKSPGAKLSAIVMLISDEFIVCVGVFVCGCGMFVWGRGMFVWGYGV